MIPGDSNDTLTPSRRKFPLNAKTVPDASTEDTGALRRGLGLTRQNRTGLLLYCGTQHKNAMLVSACVVSAVSFMNSNVGCPNHTTFWQPQHF